MDTRVVHYLTEPPALAVRNLIRLFQIEGFRNYLKTLNNRKTADHLHAAISNLRMQLCRHLCLSNLLVGKTLPLPTDVIGNNCYCKCAESAFPWPPRLRHFLSCRMYAVCQACHTEGCIHRGCLGRNKRRKMVQQNCLWCSTCGES